ncbi:hypothetical protein PR048_000705 [Dryococelus australis]|uniref:Uncharacterized protein n=1 Tax=Dryococelus australis TaxID=614101 RepID=A0ABQ9IHR1_9NEOP|nr:hypothetical protein PR048_000705 [Dryococelus australis]
MFPRYESHYSRKKNANKQFMLMEYSVASLYEHYVTHYCMINKCDPVSEDKYRLSILQNRTHALHAMTLKTKYKRRKMMQKSVNSTKLKKSFIYARQRKAKRTYKHKLCKQRMILNITGSEEIVSCQKKYFDNNDIHGETLVAILDNCCQNKNWNMIFSFFLVMCDK